VDTDAASGHAGHDASIREAHDAGTDARGHGDAGRTADARAADVAVDATTVDASVREASSHADAGPHDATQHVEATAEAGPVDAGHDSTAADAPDADAAPVCAYPDASTGTIDVLAQIPGVTIQDFDIDSDNVFFTTSTGGILSCPATGCGARRPSCGQRSRMEACPSCRASWSGSALAGSSSRKTSRAVLVSARI
jgi:hypothetical protein